MFFSASPTPAHARCGGDAWVPPPHGWQEIVRRSWPLVWYQIPSAPDGWCDLLMAFSEHVSEFGIVGLHDAIEDIHGSLGIDCAHDDAEVRDVATAYEEAALTICTVCGGLGSLRTLERQMGIRGWVQVSVQVRCDQHRTMWTKG